MTPFARELAAQRGVSLCRGCGAGRLDSVLDLGRLPLANELSSEPQNAAETFPLHLRICTACGLGQVGEVVPPNRIFSDDYPYFSSTSSSWVQHARRYAAKVSDELRLASRDLVVEIASNDGYLLREFVRRGVKVLGVEPARQVARVAEADGIDVLHQFFTASVAEEIRAQWGVPRLIVANNVVAHVPDLGDFIDGLAILSGPETAISIENPSLATLLSNGQFDTIYHEHFSYLSAHSVARAAELHGLQLVCVESLPTHGGSNRYWLRHGGSQMPDDSVARVLASEVNAGMLDPETWRAFAERSRHVVDSLRAWLRSRPAGSVTVGYGAAAKGSTLLGLVGFEANRLTAVADGSPAKQGKFLPGFGIPIVEPAVLPSLDPSAVLILPWNIADELTDTVARAVPAAEVWTAIPEMRRIR